MESVDMLLEPLRAFLLQIGAFLPRLLLALLVLVAGWLLAKARALRGRSRRCARSTSTC